MFKKIVFISIFFSAPAFADWYCEAYCPTTDGAKLMYQHGNHPVDVLNAVVQECVNDEYGRNGNHRLFVIDNGSNVQASIANACKQIDVSCK